MESLAPPLLLAEFVISSIENGDSVRSGIKTYLQNSGDDDYSRLVGVWIFSIEQGIEHSALVTSMTSPHRSALLTILEMGLQGQTIYERLIELSKDTAAACEAEIEDFLSLLPLRLLLPIMLFMFPAFLILLLGPMLSTFSNMLR